MGRGLHRGARCSAGREGAGPAASLGSIRGTPLSHSAARLPEEAAGFRRRRGRGTGYETCPWLQEFPGGAGLSPRLAGSGPRRPVGAGSCRGNRRNLYYLLDPAAQLIEGKASVGRNPAPAGDDRRHTQWCEILPLQTCCPTSPRMLVARGKHPGLRYLRDARDLRQPAARQAWPKGWLRRLW